MHVFTTQMDENVVLVGIETKSIVIIVVKKLLAIFVLHV